jgi:hypothetical protein
MPSISCIEAMFYMTCTVLACFLAFTHLNTSIKNSFSLLLIDFVDHVEWKSNFEAKKLLNLMEREPQHIEETFAFSLDPVDGTST